MPGLCGHRPGAFFGHQGGKARDAGNINCDPRRERHVVPRTLYVEVDSAGEEISAVWVGGQVVLVAEWVVRF